jgi:hypothetical protein
MKGLLACLVALATLLALSAAAQASVRLVAVTAPPAVHHADPSLKTYVYRSGPRRIGPYQMRRGSEPVRAPRVQGAIVAMDARLVDPRGREIPQYEVMLHHIVFVNDARHDGACGRRGPGQRFFGTSEELRPLTLPRGYGYPTSPRDPWHTSWMVMNHRARVRSAEFEYRVTVDTRPGLVPVLPLWLSVLPCRENADPQWSVPGGGAPGSTARTSRTWRLPAGGRIVAMGAHLHGGARGLEVSRPACGNAPLYRGEPAYALADDPLYQIRPLLHEPDPKRISWVQSAQGWSAPRGSRLRVSAEYDGERPHMRVMGIAHVYVARGVRAGRVCDPPPTDQETLGADFEGRAEPPAVGLTLATVRRDGVARPIDRPAGPLRRLGGDALVRVNHFAFSLPNLSVPRGARVTWRFDGSTPHDATLASGPVGFASPTARRGARWSRRFTRPGEYRIACSLHPVYMSQYLRVRG